MSDVLVTTLVVSTTALAGLWLLFNGLPRLLARDEEDYTPATHSGTPVRAEYDCHPAPVVPFTVPEPASSCRN
ncbi:hypothetical protein ACRS6B_20180 [Nocardia asteroides]